MKIQRDYSLTIGTPPYGPPVGTATPNQGFSYAQEQQVIKPPFTLEFDIRREFMGSSQTATFRIKNLKEKTRDSLYHDYFAGFNIMPVELRAGYANSFLPIIFSGRVMQGNSFRSDRRNMVTEITCWGFGIGTSFTSLALPPSYPTVDAIKRLNGDLAGVSSTPIIGSVPSTLGPRHTVLVGPTFSLIQSVVPPWITATIDNNQLLVLADQDVIQFGDSIFEISSATGLLDPPVRDGIMVSCRMLFEPRIKIGQYVILNSEDNSIFNGRYQVRGISHFGIISPAEGGQAFTTLQLFIGLRPFNVLSGAIATA